MADTLRNLTSLQTILADNTSGAISPQDVRDFLFSMKRPHGSIYITASAATTISVAGTYYKAAGTTALSTDTSHYLFDMPANNRLRYTGSPACHVHIAVTVSMTTAGTNDILGLKVAKNGTVMDHSVTRRFVGTGTDVGSTALHADTQLAQNEYLELFVTNESATADVTIDNMYLFALGMFE